MTCHRLGKGVISGHLALTQAHSVVYQKKHAGRGYFPGGVMLDQQIQEHAHMHR